MSQARKRPRFDLLEVLLLLALVGHPEVRQQILDYFVAHGYTLVGNYLRADTHNLYFMPESLNASLRLRARLHLLLTPSIWSDDALRHAIVAGAALLFAYIAKALSNLDPLTVDFSIFYVTARAWLEGQPMYGQIVSSVQLVNYNPPHFHLLVLPFAILPRSVSFVSWTVVSAALACATVRIAIRESAQQWPHRNVRLLVASTFLAAGVGATVRLGQLSWWLALSVTIAWRAARQKRSVVAGFWLGLAIGVKPFLLLLLPIVAIRREMVIAIVATVTALASVSCWRSIFRLACRARLGTSPDAASVRAAALFHQRVDCRPHLARRAAARSQRSPRRGCRSWHRCCCPAR